MAAVRRYLVRGGPSCGKVATRADGQAADVLGQEDRTAVQADLELPLNAVDRCNLTSVPDHDDVFRQASIAPELLKRAQDIATQGEDVGAL